MSARLVLVPFVGAMLAAPGIAEARELFAVKEFPAFKVVVPDDKAGWCGETAKVTIEGQSGDQFIANQPVVERIVGGVRAVMSFECPQAKQLQLTGMAEGQPIYQATAAAANNWALEGARLRSADELALIADMETIGRCDTLGAGPGDPQAVATAVADDRLDAPALIAACQNAVAIDTDTPRLRYQLARGYLSSDRQADALEQLVPAAEAGHGASLSLLADLHLVGAAGLEADPIAARALYQQAASAGFEPAATALQSFDDQTEALAQAEAEEAQAAQQREVAARQPSAPARASGGSLNTQGYEYPQFMTAIYSGDYANTGFDRRYTQVYAVHMADMMRQVCRGSFTIAEINGWRRLALSEIDMSAQAGMAAMGNTLMTIVGIANGTVNVAEMQANAIDVESLPQQAGEDAVTFIERNDCESATFARFTANMKEAVK